MRLSLLVVSALLLAACRSGTEGLESSAPDATAPAAPLTTASAVAERMAERFQHNVGALDHLAVTTTLGTLVYGDAPGGLFAAPPDVRPAPGAEPPGPEVLPLLTNYLPNVGAMTAGLARATLEGPIDRDGRWLYVLSTHDPAALFGTAAPTEDSSSTLDFRVYVDAGTFDVVEIYQGLTDSTLARPYTTRFLYDDFRTVDGVTLPFRVRQVETGADALYSDQDRIVLNGQLGFRRQQLQAMPPGAERDAQMAQVDRIHQRMTEGTSELTLTVESVQVGTPGEASPAAP